MHAECKENGWIYAQCRDNLIDCHYTAKTKMMI